MKIVMTLLVRNEEDILATNIDYHLAQGVDYFIVTDNLSCDRTPEILRSYEARGVLHVIHEPSDDYSQHRWVTRMARMAATEYQADWVINNDADEFWWPSHHRSLRHALQTVPIQANAIKVSRSNFPLTQSQSSAALQDDPSLHCPPSEFLQRQIVRDTRSVNAIGRPLPPKMMHRAHPQVDVEQGNHGVHFPDQSLILDSSGLLEIFHFPVRSYEQYRKKIENGGAAYERNTEFDRQVGLTWRHLYSELQAGRFLEYFRSESIPDHVVESRDANPRYVVDVRLRDYMLGIISNVSSD